MNRLSFSSSQQGNTTLLMVLVTMALASGILHLTSNSLRYGAQQVNDEKNYLRAFYQAQSALAWGRTHSWSTTQGWQCPSSPSTSFTVCFWRTSQTDGWLRGASEKSEWLLWQRVIFSDVSPLRPQRHPRGWIDDCPLSADQCGGKLPGDKLG
ncbi:DUF2509 family protein [Rosenbergiella nectarea]|uniref:DUF2509 family protein n=1 Tax=Rosenbergiella nectarea TaxID=988801 RepID=UPI001BD9B5F9|nr:DUF2509 family protein [Rosenbergiella nectarea]MBT0729863.1 YgdB family protein [Rosenbergiella nectarea subsp. apis]